MTEASAEMKIKADAFYALHHAPNAFIIPNPWDRGTARILAHMGFKALATTSMGYAFSIGQRDNSLTRDQTLANAADIASASALPVNADLENGFGNSRRTRRKPSGFRRTLELPGDRSKMPAVARMTRSTVSAWRPNVCGRRWPRPVPCHTGLL